MIILNIPDCDCYYWKGNHRQLEVCMQSINDNEQVLKMVHPDLTCDKFFFENLDHQQIYNSLCVNHNHLHELCRTLPINSYQL